jgi:hypothetical protein
VGVDSAASRRREVALSAMPAADAWGMVPHVMTVVLTAAPPRTELAHREQHGTAVTLYWTRETNIVTVAVTDRKSGRSFEFVLESHEPPLDVYYHPYAYAANRGLGLDA